MPGNYENIKSNWQYYLIGDKIDIKLVGSLIGIKCIRMTPALRWLYHLRAVISKWKKITRKRIPRKKSLFLNSITFKNNANIKRFHFRHRV